MESGWDFTLDATPSLPLPESCEALLFVQSGFFDALLPIVDAHSGDAFASQSVKT